MLKKGNHCRCSSGEKVFKGLLFLLSALAGVALFTESTSPLFSGWGYDSAMFQTIGKYWAEGYLPYVDLYDHKGPMIFFINALGYGLGGRNGVYIIQVLSIALSEAIACRLLADRLSRGKSLALALLLPFVLAANWQEGNTTEEYILPLLFGSYFLMARWCGGLEEGRFAHRAGAAFVYGLCFGFALMTRVTNALGVCLGVAFITVLLAVKGEWKNLLANAGAFLLGAAVPVLPFCVYFAAHGALYDMWYGTLLYNLDYLSSSGFPRPEGLVQLLVLVRLYLPGWCLIAAALWMLASRERERERERERDGGLAVAAGGGGEHAVSLHPEPLRPLRHRFAALLLSGGKNVGRGTWQTGAEKGLCCTGRMYDGSGAAQLRAAGL